MGTNSKRCRRKDCIYRASGYDHLPFNCNYLSITGRSRTKEICERYGISCSDPRRHALLSPGRCPLYEAGMLERQNTAIVLRGSRRKKTTYDWSIARRMAAEGARDSEIKKALGCTYGAIYAWKRRSGLIEPAGKENNDRNVL